MPSNPRTPLFGFDNKLIVLFSNLYLWLLTLLGIAILGLLAIAVYPEPTAKLLTNYDSWDSSGGRSNEVRFNAIPEQYRQVRQSITNQSDGILFRTWTPDNGIVPIALTSGPFRPTRFMSVTFTGANRTPNGYVQAYIECELNNQRREIFRGSVNVNVAEAIVVLPENWCPGDARLKFMSQEDNINTGVGSVFEISYLSYLKSTFLGRIPYFLSAFAIFSLVMLVCASIASRLGWYGDLLPIAFVSLGAFSLAVFYLASGVRVFASVILIMVITYAFRWSGREARMKAARELAPYARLWFLASLVYFSVLGLVTNGVGHWDPNYRFWPAIWSSDNELPWLFAEAIRRGWGLKDLFGGGWLPTDRPPLMAGSYLLVSDVFGLLQSGNDGTYLRGQAYNAAAVILNALWVPAVWWLLTTLRREMDNRDRALFLIFMGCLPFVLFNTAYGWPKAFGAAFALVSFGLAWQFRERDSVISPHKTIILFFVLGAFSMLAHASTALFLAPLGLLFLWWSLRCNTRSVMVGFAIALLLLASWSLYKWLVLPSADPVTKFALTGDYGFGHPDWTLWQMLLNRYGELDFWQWLEIKKTMLLQAFLPLNHSITQIGLNSDFGSGAIDKLRAWDFMLLSKGNLAIPIFIVTAAWAMASEFFLHRQDVNHTESPFRVLIIVSMIAWLLVVIGFLVPPVLPVWPQAALFGLALGGAVIVHDRYPLIFFITMLATMTYTGLVWFLLPLQSALTIDVGAAFVIVVLVVWVLMSTRLQSP